MIAYNDCRHFLGDRPCTPHKRDGVQCRDCRYYDSVKERILIIKLAADGDVLRTTCLLPSLKKKYPSAHITWVTESSAVPLLLNNPCIDRIWAPPERYYAQLGTEEFDLAINTDADSRSCSLSALARASEKKGFLLGSRGEIIPLSTSAVRWYELGIRDDLKRANRKTYPEIIHGIADLPLFTSRPMLVLAQGEIEEARNCLINRGWQPDNASTVLAFNTGAGRRWWRKSLPLKTIRTVLERLLNSFPDIQLFLLGGPEEAERNCYLMSFLKDEPRVVDAGTDNTLRQFAAIIAHTDVLISGDTLAMHIGTALKKYVIAHFGPTSPWEIDLQELGEKIVPAVDCLSCYLPDCDESPACNELITAEHIIHAVRRALSTVRSREAG